MVFSKAFGADKVHPLGQCKLPQDRHAWRFSFLTQDTRIEWKRWHEENQCEAGIDNLSSLG